MYRALRDTRFLMKDFFALLSQPRNPWLDPETVKQVFVSAAAESHPDRIHDSPERERREAHDRYTELNEAHLCLKDHRHRLRHLLELERGERIRDLQEIPDDLMELFERLSQQLRAVDVHCRESAQATSPLLKVTLFERGEELRGQLEQTRTLLQERLDTLEGRLRASGDDWSNPPAGDGSRREALLTNLEALYRLLSFHMRWHGQVQNRILQLMGQG